MRAANPLPTGVRAQHIIEQANEIIRMADQGDGDGELTMNELRSGLANTKWQRFLDWFSHISSKLRKQFDLDDSGTFEADEIAYALQVGVARTRTRVPCTGSGARERAWDWSPVAK